MGRTGRRVFFAPRRHSNLSIQSAFIFVGLLAPPLEESGTGAAKQRRSGVRMMKLPTIFIGECHLCTFTALVAILEKLRVAKAIVFRTSE